MNDNWQKLLQENRRYFERQYRDRGGNVYTFFGLVDDGEDYYYGMFGNGKLRLLSCVGSLETHGFELNERFE